jgi:hypothetical protein
VVTDWTYDLSLWRYLHSPATQDHGP